MLEMPDSSVPRAVSYSGGTSSEWQVEAIYRGVIERPERYAVFFADTGAEHSWTYKAVAEVEERCHERGVTFVRCGRDDESLVAHVMRTTRERASRMDHPPFWVETSSGRGRLEQRCTQKWKSRVLRKAIRAWLKSIGAPLRCVSLIGFAADEMSRAVKAHARRNEVKWETLDFPAIRAGVTRDEQRRMLVAWTGRAPRFSMCTFCPFKSPQRWRETEGADLEQALAVDRAVRDLSYMGVTGGDVYCSDRLISVEEARTNVVSDEEKQCDTGMCFL